MWESILKRKPKMSEKAKDFVDTIMTSEPRTVEVIYNSLLDAVERRRKEKKKGTIILGNNLIPSKRELGSYLRINYSKEKLNPKTMKPSPTGKMHYWKGE
jgi:hypothetical protein